MRRDSSCVRFRLSIFLLLCAGAFSLVGCGRPLKADFSEPLAKAVALADFYDKLAYVQERFDKTGRITDPVDRAIVNMVLQQGSNTANNVVDLLTVYHNVKTFNEDAHADVIRHIHNRLVLLKENSEINMRLLKESRGFVFDEEVLKHVTDMVQYFQEINAVLQEAITIAAARMALVED